MVSNAHLIAESFEEVAQQGEAFIAAFYEKFFNQFPEVKLLFPKDMRKQRKKLLLAMTTIVGALDEPHLLTPYLEDLGEFHQGHQVLSRHFPMFRQALLDTLAQFLGQKWTPELKQAWTEAYDAVTTAMLNDYPAGKTES